MIAYDSFGESDASGTSGGTALYSFNNVGGNFLLCAVYADSSTCTADGQYYGGDILTELFSHRSDADYLWVGYLANPKTGTNNMAVNFTNAPSAYRTGAITFTGVNTGNPIGGSSSVSQANDATTPISATVTVQGLSGLVIDFLNGSRVDSGNAVSPQTEAMNNTGTYGGGVNHLAGMSYVAHTGSNVTMSWENLAGMSSRSDKEYYAVELLSTAFIPSITVI